MPIAPIPPSDRKSIISTANLISPVHVVKELIENSIDSFQNLANLKSQITVEIDSNTGGLEYISVKDNGPGVDAEDRIRMCHNHCTSKITSYADIESGISTLGFRGEALFNITQQGQLTIVSRTHNETMGEKWSVDKNGDPLAKPEMIAVSVGTIVTVRRLFSDLPVRKVFFKKESRKTLAAVYDLLVSYSLSHRNIRFYLKHVEVLHNSDVVTKTNVALNAQLPVLKLFAHILKAKDGQFFEVKKSFTTYDLKGEAYDVLLSGIFPKTRAQDISFPKSMFKVLTVNRRPLNLKLTLGKEISSLIAKVFTENMVLAPNIWYLEISVPDSKVDINIEPEKSDLLIANVDQMLLKLKDTLFSSVAEIHDSATNAPASSIVSLSTPGFKTPLTSNKASKDDDTASEESDLDRNKGQFVEESRMKSNTGNGDSSIINEQVPELPVKSGTNLKTQYQDPPGQENEWSFTMCDTAMSDETFLGSSSHVDEDEDITMVDDINIVNPFTIAKMNGKFKPASSTISSGISPKSITTHSRKPFKSPLKESNTWATSNAALLDENIKSTRLKMLSENTLLEETELSIVELKKDLNTKAYETENRWVIRKGFPSFDLIDGYSKLLKQSNTFTSEPEIKLQKLKEGWFSASFA